ncbi:HAMP domain-containing histidine kinase [Rhizobiaceae bacterium BDR2-2]|uniref:histidine kinase n=1 Tax=Ectorhizobium quercum TaxID=2965071 RepID=A0AAE3N1I5_9HYPH|nr:HAMP domain-containing sensor histidine kinase [Ectorhizobium quercum]MCX8998451.1 HAMP domain-containing histidine kinase [Ectorhizobium quercum]
MTGAVKSRTASLTARVLLLATLWSALALVGISFAISKLYRESTERGFNDILRAQLYNVINAISINDQQAITGTPQLGDLRFSQPGSGWYWVVEPLGNFSTPALVSSSLGVSGLAVPSVLEAPFDRRYERFYALRDSSGNRVQVAETEVILDGEGRAARFRVTGNLAVVEEQIADFSRSLHVALAVFGFGSLLLNGLAILYGLKPLDRARAALGKVRNGEAERLEGDFPREIQPLANEMNALIDSNRRLVERARMQVGNLAHSLKTPIAVLLNEATLIEKQQGDVVRAQAEAMQAQVQTYLHRARIAAQRESVLARTEVDPVIERLVRVMRRLNPDTHFELAIAQSGLMLAMEQQDVEEVVGNLIENAARYAVRRVDISAEPVEAEEGDGQGKRHWIELLVEDDGPGLDSGQIEKALKRGTRLDESKPGTGLGLSIVREIAGEYHGTLTLSRGDGGGLKARLLLPAVVKEHV